MTETDELRPAFVGTFPTSMKPGVLYVSLPYRTCGHLCCCGCGNEVITPLSPAQWALTYDGESVSLAPSVGNWALRCQSHYWIRHGRIHWSRRYSAEEIDENRYRDRQQLGMAENQTRLNLLDRLRRRWHRRH
ncbi:DUF6527 family protein [Streptomyces sp. NPDC058807]|uniref:DUF6527 family protein n=1 Tax=unclassified Streptomyces TaxID=2593676 RepID=UPI0036C337C2